MSLELIIYPLLLNLLFIIIVLLFTGHLYNRKALCMHENKGRNLTIFLASGVCVLFCISVSVEIEQGFLFDLRSIPLVIGGLYGGPIVSIGLLVISFTYRFLFDGLGGAINYLIGGIIVTVVICILYSRFKQMRRINKVLLSTFLVTIGPIVSFILITTIWKLPISTSVLLIGIASKFVGILLIMSIIGILENSFYLQENIIRSKKLELVSNLAASVSHEVRNPLTTTKGFLQLLKETETDAKRIEFFKLSLDELERAEGIINDYLTFAKPSDAKLRTLSLDIELIKIIDIIRPMANMFSVEIHLNLLPLTFKGDPKYFKQAILNVCKNCIEAMEGGGTLKIDVIQKGDMIHMGIKDTGVGMTPQQLSRLGEPYFTTKELNGTGLGMMVTYSVIHSLNGTIHTHSSAGKGTTFTIMLPYHRIEVNNGIEEMVV